MQNTQEQPIRRYPVDIFRLLLSAANLLGSTLVARERQVRRLEIDVFNRLNALPAVLEVPIWVVMQMGSFAAVWLAAALASLRGRRRLALELAGSGSLAYFLAKLIKAYVRRGRPFSLLERVLVRGPAAEGLGYPSGHTAVASALAVTLAPHLKPWPRRLSGVLVWVVGFARIYVGAHLPLDIVGGRSLGRLAAYAARLAGGTSSPPPPTLEERVLPDEEA